MREGGVEPPRPCGHWNLNPARLPIPPPAHWVCLPAPALSARPLPTPRTLARRTGWIHIASRRAPPPGHHPRRARRAPQRRTHRTPHVSRRRASRINLVPVQAICPGGGPGPQPGAGHWTSPTSTIHAAGHAPGSSKGSRWGNRLIGGRVDTISEQYQQYPARQPAKQRPSGGRGSGTEQARRGRDGGGAPWES